MAFSKNIIRHIDLSYKLLFGAFKNDLANGAKPGILHQIWVFNAFLGFSTEDLRFLRFNCIAVIQHRV